MSLIDSVVPENHIYIDFSWPSSELVTSFCILFSNSQDLPFLYTFIQTKWLHIFLAEVLDLSSILLINSFSVFLSLSRTTKRSSKHFFFLFLYHITAVMKNLVGHHLRITFGDTHTIFKIFLLSPQHLIQHNSFCISYISRSLF